MNSIVIVSMVRNEADVIESFVRHHLEVADAIEIVDHASTDGTSEILEKLCAEGLPLTVLRYDGVAQVQAELLTQCMAQAFEAGADLVLPLDGDEFLWPEASGSMAAVRAALCALSPAAVYELPWVRCALVQPEEGEDVFLPHRPARRAVKPDALGKVMVGREAFLKAQAAHGRLAQGNHHFLIDGADGPQRIVPQRVHGIFLAHFPQRSAAQAASKAAVGWLSNVAKYSQQTTKANHWRRAFERLRNGERVGMAAEGGEMVPLPPVDEAVAQSLRYPMLQENRVLRNVLAAAEELAEAYRESEVLRLARRVTIILPYFGAAEPFEQSLASILGEGYPFTELLVLPLVEDDFAAQLPQFLGSQEASMTIAIAEGSDIAARFRDLAQTAAGDYIQWVLPGDLLLPGKFLRMVCALEGDASMTFVTSRAHHEAAEDSTAGELVLPLDAPFMLADGTQIADALRTSGQVLSGGLTAPLFRRRDMERWGWFSTCFSSGRPGWQRLRDTILPGSVLGVMRQPQVIAESMTP